MKILVVAPTSFFSHRGCHIRIFEEAKFLIHAGNTVKIVTYHLGDDIDGFDIERILNFFWYKKIGAGASWHKIYLDFFLLMKTIGAYRRFKPDIVHCHLHEGALVGILMGFIVKNKIIFDSQGSLVDELTASGFIKPGSLTYRFFLKIEKYIYKKSHKIIVSNRSNYEVLKNLFQIEGGRLAIIPDGIDLEKAYVNIESVRSLRSELAVEPGKKVIIYLGTLNDVEGIDDLLHVAADLKKITNDFVLLVMGYPNVEHYSDLAKRIGLRDEVRFLGRINYSQLYDYLTLGDFAISFKHKTSEGNGKLLNYAMAGLPVICYDHDTNRNILFENAYYIPSDADSRRAAKRVYEILHDEGTDVTQVAVRAGREVAENLTWQNMVGQLINCYHVVKEDN